MFIVLRGTTFICTQEINADGNEKNIPHEQSAQTMFQITVAGQQILKGQDSLPAQTLNVWDCVTHSVCTAVLVMHDGITSFCLSLIGDGSASAGLKLGCSFVDFHN